MRSAAMSSAKDRLVSLLIAETIFVLDVAATNMQCCGLRLFDQHSDHIRGARKARTCRKPCQRRCQRPSCDRDVGAEFAGSNPARTGPILNRYLAALSSQLGI